MLITPGNLFLCSIFLIAAPVLSAGVASWGPSLDEDDLFVKAEPFLALIGLAGIGCMVWSGWLAIRPMLG